MRKPDRRRFLFAVLAAVVLALVGSATALAQGATPGDDPGNLDGLTSLEYWHLLAAALPVVIGRIGDAAGWTGATAKARLAIGVYFAYAVIGEVLKGSFDTLSWDTPQLVLASLIKIAAVSYASYKIVGNAAPRITAGRPGPTA